MIENLEIYQAGKLTFIISPKKILVRTAKQSFYLRPTEHLLSKKMRIIRTMIQLGEIQDLNDLAISCGHEIGWVHTHQKFDIDNSPQFAKLNV